MDYIELNPPRDHLQTMIIDDVLKHLRTEKDENLALRTALLLAVNLLQMEDDLPAVDFCNAMLETFSPLARHFEENNNEHTFCAGYKAIRARDENDNLKVFIPTEYIQYVAGSNLDEGSM